MSRQYWEECLAAANADGTAIANSTSATSLLTGTAAHAKYTLPANWFEVGRQLQIIASGRISNIVTTPGNLTVSVRLGATTVFTSGTFNLNTTAKTNVGWWLELLLTCRSVGASTSATILGQGVFTSESVVGAASGTALPASLPASAPAVGTGFDSSTSQQVDLFAQFSVANAGNSIQLHQYSLQALN